MMKKIKLPPGFKIEVYASNVLAARQMAWGDKGTLFVGSFGLGNVYAITDNGGKKEVKTILKGLNMPTGLAYRDGALYVIATDKLIKYENAEANLANLGTGKVVYDDIAVLRRAWLEIYRGRQGRLVLPPVRTLPSTSAFPRPACRRSAASIPKPAMRKSTRSASATQSAATSIHAPANTGSPKTPRDWISDDLPSDKLNMISKGSGEHFGYPYCHQGNLPDTKFAMGHKCSEFTRPCSISARMWRRSA